MLVKISVRNLIEFVMRSGDIDNSFRDNARMIEGIRAHQKIQKSYGKNYTKEYKLKHSINIAQTEFLVEGRADGLIKENDSYVIDEIKSTKRDLDEIDDSNQMHWAQAKCYAYFFACDNDLSTIDVTLTYVSLENYKTRIFRRTFNKDELEIFYIDLLNRYIEFSKIISKNIEQRNSTSKNIDFPYNSYRKGQRKMAVAIYTAILDEKNIFIDAPTGIGKTISSIFPSIKSFSEDLADKIFYLTAKNTTSKEAIKAIKLLEEKGLRLKAVQITSKEKICLNDEVKCNTIDCPFAKGHFDRVNDALKDILTNESIMDYDIITSYAEKHRVCPLEFEFDISTFSDFIICDYNYIFDPNVYLRRFFDELVDRYIFLIDEAHNLLDRARDMYSFSFSNADFIELKNCLDVKRDKKIIKIVDDIIEYFENNYIKFAKRLHYYTTKQVLDLDEKLILLSKKMENFLIKEKDDKNYDFVLEIYFRINSYLRISDQFMDGFYNVISFDEENEEKTFEIKCVDPSYVLKKKYDLARTSIFFSATLSPMKFFMIMLGAKSSLKLRLDMPFSSDKLMIIQKSISTRYKDRFANISKISDLIYEFVQSRKGNYFIFFPSFDYLEKIAGDYMLRHNEEILIQDRSMNQIERSRFLNKFTDDSSEVAFVVLGGVFAEGVDLIGNKLIGSMIISVGMPGLSFDRNLIKEHFDRKNMAGFDYSYTYPGINKVFQAAGRVIRSENDRGIIYLVDDRYTWIKYQSLFPKHWKNIRYLDENEHPGTIIDEFWSKDEKKENWRS